MKNLLIWIKVYTNKKAILKKDEAIDEKITNAEQVINKINQTKSLNKIQSIINTNENLNNSQILFNNASSQNQDSNKQNMFNYFQYKLLDFNGENLDSTSYNNYENTEKIKLFNESSDYKENYNHHEMNVNINESEEEGKKIENFFGPQRSNFS